jgi:ketopantoate reductase
MPQHTAEFTRSIIDERCRVLEERFKLKLLDMPCMGDIPAGELKKVAANLAAQAHFAMLEEYNAQVNRKLIAAEKAQKGL